MKQHIHLGAIVARDGRILLLRPQPAAAWELPGGPLPLDADDTDAEMDAILTRLGVNAPAIEDDFVDTVYMPADDGQVVYNIYAASEWAGEPVVPAGVGSGWFGLAELEAIEMHAPVREAVLTAFGLREPVDRTADIIAALSSGPTLLESVAERPPSDGSRLAAGLDVLRTLSAGDPNAEAELRAGTPELADDILEFSMGNVWQDPALDRRTRSLLVVAMLVTQGQLASLKSHVGGALNHGATPEQVIQTLRMVAVYAGFPAAVAAWPLMEEAFAEHGIRRPNGGRA